MSEFSGAVVVMMTAALFAFVWDCRAETAAVEPSGVGAVSLVEGEIGATSRLIDPEASDYPDCYMIVRFKVKNIISGPSTGENINLAVPGFFNRKVMPSALWRNGTKIQAVIIPAGDASPKEVATQQADDFNDFIRETYFLREGEIIRQYSIMPDPVFLDRSVYRSKFSMPMNAPRDPVAAIRRDEQIRADLARISSAPDESSIPAADLQKKWSAMQNQYPLFRPDVFWFQVGTGVFALPRRIDAFWNRRLPPKVTEEAIPALCELNEFLRSKNVDLIVVVYPHYYPVAIRAMFPETTGIPLKGSSEIVKLLLERNVEAIDLSGEIVKLIPRSEFLFYYYHLNGHPGWETQDLAGRLIADRLLRYGVKPILDPELFCERRVAAASLPNYVYPAGLPIGSGVPGKRIKTNCTFYDQKRTVSNPDSPVVMWGNSFLLWPANFALATAVAKNALYFPEIRFGSGCFTSMLKDLLLSPETYLTGKKVIVMPISTDMLEAYKIWNIKELDRDFTLSEHEGFVAGVELPDDIERETVQKMLGVPEYMKSIGKCYMLQKEPLSIPLPAVEKNGKTLWIKISFANNNSMVFSLGKTRKTVYAPATFMIENIYLPYDPAAGVLAVSRGGDARALLIRDIAIVESGL